MKKTPERAGCHFCTAANKRQAPIAQLPRQSEKSQIVINGRPRDDDWVFLPYFFNLLCFLVLSLSPTQ